jgi:palmitoyl-protein thioesterase
VVQAQYFRDAYNLHTYLQNSQFLADINNERDTKNVTYAKQISSLKKLVLFRFSNDTTVVPRDSAWFSFQDGDSLMPLRSTALYQMDWLGLYHLDGAGSVIMDEAPGVHMQFTLDWFEAKVIIPWLATPSAMDDALLLGPTQTQAATAYA